MSCEIYLPSVRFHGNEEDFEFFLDGVKIENRDHLTQADKDSNRIYYRPLFYKQEVSLENVKMNYGVATNAIEIKPKNTSKIILPFAGSFEPTVECTDYNKLFEIKSSKSKGLAISSLITADTATQITNDMANTESSITTFVKHDLRYLPGDTIIEITASKPAYNEFAPVEYQKHLWSNFNNEGYSKIAQFQNHETKNSAKSSDGYTIAFSDLIPEDLTNDGSELSFRFTGLTPFTLTKDCGFMISFKKDNNVYLQGNFCVQVSELTTWDKAIAPTLNPTSSYILSTQDYEINFQTPYYFTTSFQFKLDPPIDILDYNNNNLTLEFWKNSRKITEVVFTKVIREESGHVHWYITNVSGSPLD